MKTLIPLIVPELRAGHSVALATVIQSVGSAPRGAGACQLLLEDGRDFGTVGGGLIERRALDELEALLITSHVPSALSGNEKRDSLEHEHDAMSESFPLLCDTLADSHIQEYVLTQNEVLSLGMVCGGTVRMLFQLITPAMFPFFSALNASLTHSRENCWLVRGIQNSKVVSMAAVTGTQNPSTLDDIAFSTLHNRCANWFDAPALNDMSYFIEPVLYTAHTYIFGCGHVAQCVAPLLGQLDFSPIVYDDRPEFASRALFPTAFDVICAPYTQAAERLNVTQKDEIVIMTRGHENDFITLQFALRTPSYYVGLIGSHSKVLHTKNMVLEQGFTPQDFARVHTPIGVPILAETPMEIAVSVAAEMIRCRAERASCSAG